MDVIYSDRTNYVQTKSGSPDGVMHIMESSQGNTPTAMVNEIAVVKGEGERERNINICRRCVYREGTQRGNSRNSKTMKPHYTGIRI
jgi:hypothetical protein